MDKHELIENMPMHEYLGLTDYLSGSMLAGLLNRADKYHIRQQGYEEAEKEDHLIGSLTHTLVLEPQQYDKEYHLIPKVYLDEKGNEKKWIERKGSSWVKKDIEEADGRRRIKARQLEEATIYSEAIDDNPIAREYLKGEGINEATLLVKSNGIGFKSRPDRLIKTRDIHVNIKTAQSSKPDQFYKQGLNLGYDISAALGAYCHEMVFGRPLKDYIFIVVEKDPPYCPVEVYKCSESIFEAQNINYIQFGAYRLKQAIKKYFWCKDNNCWPAYDSMQPQSIKTMKVPEWAMNIIEDIE